MKRVFAANGVWMITDEEKLRTVSEHIQMVANID